jgi:hypothetical protein
MSKVRLIMRTHFTVAMTLCVFALAGCVSDSKTAAAHPEDPLSDVMWAKLGLARAILEGLVTEDYAAIERNAVELHRLSEHASWMVTDSVTYVVSSDRFRQIVDDLAQNARGGDLSMATDDFALMTETCIACHTYLRRERLATDYPERISSAGGAVDLLSLLPMQPGNPLQLADE